MNFTQGFISGLIITLIVIVFTPLNQWMISEIITPEYFNNVIVYSVKSGYHTSLKKAQTQFKLENYILQSSVGALVMGLLTSAIVALFVRKKE